MDRSKTAWSPAIPTQWVAAQDSQALLTKLADTRPKVLGLVFDPALQQSLQNPLAASHTRAFAEQEHRVALAVGVKPADRRILGIYGLGFDAVDALKPLWQIDPPPYTVFYRGQRDLHILAQRELHPKRLGCLRSASYLLDRALGVAPEEYSPQQQLEKLKQSALNLQVSLPDILAQQANALLSLMAAYTQQLRQHELVSAFELETSLLPAVVDMERAGFFVDAPAYENIVRSWQGALAQSQGPAEQKSRQKLLSTYRWWCRDFLHDDQRLRCHLDPLATASGRFSCSQPNLQQVPNSYTAPGLRACFRAPPGKTLIIADYSQIEMRVAAHLAGCDKLRALFRSGYDPHRATAAALTHKAMDAIDDHERKLAKAVNFGFLFGMGSKRFQSYAQQSYGLELSQSQAQNARDSFFRAYPGIARWHQQTSRTTRNHFEHPFTVKTALGRKCSFAAGKVSFNAALNIPVQGSAAEGFKSAMLRLHQELPALGARGILCVHDEYIAEAPIENATAVCERVRQVMEEQMHKLIDSLPIVVDAQIAEHWG